MPNTIRTDYFYGDESQQFQYFRIPRLLITSPRFKDLSVDAKLLYGMMLDRMSLSVKNEWYDEDGRVFIFYTLQEAQKTLSCGHNKATMLFNELERFDLIERIKQGQGKPAKIYVKNFIEGDTAEKKETEKTDLKTSKKSTCRVPVSKPLDCLKGAGIYTDKNNTELSYTDPSINPPTPSAKQMEMERYEQRERLENQIDYGLLRQKYPYDDVDSILEMFVDVTSGTAPTIRIGGQVIPIETVKERFSQLDHEHIAYVIDSMRQTTTKINNIRAYLLTALYNTPVTKDAYYAAAVRHDFPT